MPTDLGSDLEAKKTLCKYLHNLGTALEIKKIYKKKQEAFQGTKQNLDAQFKYPS